MVEYGDPRLPDRFWEKIKVSTEHSYKGIPCWEWTASLTWDGYGKFLLDGKRRMAHRLAYEILVAEIPEGLVSDHLCRLRHCVHPKHIEPVTDEVNRKRGLRARKGKNKPRTRPNKRHKPYATQCRRGHPYDEENTGHKGDGSRYCRACKQESDLRRRQQESELSPEEIRERAKRSSKKYAAHIRYRAELRRRGKLAG